MKLKLSMIAVVVAIFASVLSVGAFPPDVSCPSMIQSVGVSAVGKPPRSASVLLSTTDVSVSLWVYSTPGSTQIASQVTNAFVELHGTVQIGLYEITQWWPPPDPNLAYFFLMASGIPQTGGPPESAVAIPPREWTLLTLSLQTDFVTVYLNETVAFGTSWASDVKSDIAKFTKLEFAKAYTNRTRSSQQYYGIQVYNRALAPSDIAARTRGDPGLCSPDPPPFPPSPPFAPSPPSPPFAPFGALVEPCISDYAPIGAFTEACYVVLPQPKLVCNGTRIAIGCGADASVRVRFPGRRDVRAVSAGACQLVVDTVGSTRVRTMAIEVVCNRPPCDPRAISVPSFSSSGECETLPVFVQGPMSWPLDRVSTARILFPSQLPVLEDLPLYMMSAVLYVPIPEVLCPGGEVYAWIPTAYGQFRTWEVGCGILGVCAPVFNYPAQNASIPYNVARTHGRFEARSDFANDVMRIRLSYTGNTPLVSAPNTAVQFSLRDYGAGGNDTIFRLWDVYYEVSKALDIRYANPDYSDYTSAFENVVRNNLFDAVSDPRFIGGFVDSQTCGKLHDQTAWCVPQPGVTSCASVCAGSRVEIVADQLSPDTVLIVFGVVRLTASSPSWKGITVGSTSADVECSGSCGMASVTFSWTNPPEGCPPAPQPDDNPTDRFICAWNAMVIYGTPASLCNVSVQDGQIVEVWVEYVSFYDSTIEIGSETFTLPASGRFNESDDRINPGCPTVRLRSFVTAVPIEPGYAWSGATSTLGAGSHELRIRSSKRRVGSDTTQGCPPADIVATVHAFVRYPDPPTSNVSGCTSASPCVVSETTIASVSTYAVSIQSEGIHRCGGYMAGPRTVVTAAHCAIALSDGATVVYGTTNLSSPGLSVSARVAGSIVHEAYDGLGDRGNDISVLTLASAFSGVDPATVSTDQPAESLAAEFGWGNGSPSLRIALVDVVSRDECVGAFGTFPESGVCMRRAGSEVVCQGDSGSPSAWIGAFSNTGDVLVRGILALPSWGAACKQGSALSVFTNLSYHIAWLQLATIASETCGGEATCIATITNGSWSESQVVYSEVVVPHQNGSGSDGGSPPSLRTQLDVANTGPRVDPRFYLIVGFVYAIL